MQNDKQIKKNIIYHRIIIYFSNTKKKHPEILLIKKEL